MTAQLYSRVVTDTHRFPVCIGSLLAHLILTGSFSVSESNSFEGERERLRLSVARFSRDGTLFAVRTWHSTTDFYIFLLVERD